MLPALRASVATHCSHWHRCLTLCSLQKRVMALVLMWSLPRLEVSLGLSTAHLGNSPCGFQKDHWFDPKGEVSLGFLQHPVGCCDLQGHVCARLLKTVTAVRSHVPQAPAWGDGWSCPL